MELLFLPGVDVSHVYIRALALDCFYSHISTQTFWRAPTASLDSCAKIVPLQWRNEIWQSLEESDAWSVIQISTVLLNHTGSEQLREGFVLEMHFCQSICDLLYFACVKSSFCLFCLYNIYIINTLKNLNFVTFKWKFFAGVYTSCTACMPCDSFCGSPCLCCWVPCYMCDICWALLHQANK